MDPQRLKVLTPAPAATAIIYTAIGCLWIFLSSDLVSSLVDAPQNQARVEVIKGVLFVVATGALLYFLLREKRKTLEPGAVTARPVHGFALVATILLLILLVPLIGYSVIALSTPEVEKRAMAHVRSVAQNNFNNIQLWIRERSRDIDSVRLSEEFADHLTAVVEQSEDAQQARRAMADRLITMVEAYGYSAIWLLDDSGDPLARFGDPDFSAASDIDNRIAALADTIEPDVSLRLLRDKAAVSVEVIAPVRRDGRLLGVLVFAISGTEQVLETFATVPADYHTRETLLVHLDETGADYLHLKRKQPEEPRVIHVGAAGSGLLGEIHRGQRDSGTLRTTDHHGNLVLASFRRLGQLPWYLVVKVDQQEALAPVRQQATWVTLLSFLTLTAISGMLLLLWRQQRKNSELSLLAATAEHEHAMREQEKIYRELFRTNPHPMWVYDRRTLRFLAVNDVAINHYGYSHDEFMAMTIRDILSPECEGRLPDHLQTTIPSGKGIDGRWQHRKKDGTAMRVEVSSHALTFNGRDAKLVLAYDMTNLLLAEEQLLESEQFTKWTLDSLEQHIAVLDDSGEIVAINRSWRDFALNNDGDISAMDIGANYLEVCRRASPVAPEAAQMLEALEDILAGNSEQYQQEYPCHAPREKRWYAAHVVRFRGGRGTRVVVSHEDVTQRKESELELRKLNRYYAAISEINSIIIRATDVDDMLHDVCRVICTQAQLQMVTVSRIEDGFIDMNCATSGGPPDFTQALERVGRIEFANYSGFGLTVSAARENRTVVSNEYLKSGLDENLRERMAGWEVGAVAICPVRCRNGMWGLLNFYATEQHHFTADLITLLEDLAADVALGIDMIELRRAGEEAEQKLILNARIISATHEGLYITDMDNRIIMANPAMTSITGYTQEELVGAHWRILDAGNRDAAFYQEVQRQLDATNRWEGEIWDRRKNGDIFPASLTITRVYDDEGDNHHQISIYRDVTERKEYERRIEHLANHDILTDLPNRFLLHDRAALAMSQAKRHGRKVAVLFIDLDNFKLVNDTLGHELGDELLKEAARRIAGTLRSSDTVSRIGGDEFLALATELRSSADASVVAEKIIEEVSRPFLVQEHNLIVTASVGVALFPDNGTDLESLSRLADAAMLKAKQSGNNRFRLYSGEVTEDQGDHLKLLNELRRAVAREQICLLYQPQFNLSTNEIVGLEALVRWEHPDYGLLAPDEFIPLAERSGLIIELGDWILTRACHQAQSWRRRGLVDFPVAVNVSALQFRQLDFVEKVHTALRETGLPGRLLELEVVESMLMIDLDDALEKLERLDKLGVKIAIDDFGTGYSSLSYLRQFSAHMIKIDKSFIRDVPGSPDASAIAQAILSMGKTLGMEIIAEGVENKEQADFLSRIGCQYGQGFYYARPMAAVDIEKMLGSLSLRRSKGGQR